MNIRGIATAVAVPLVAAVALGGAAQASWSHSETGAVTITASNWTPPSNSALSGSVTFSPYHGGFNATLTVINTGNAVKTFTASFPVTAKHGTMTWAPTGNNIAAIPVTYANGIVTVTGTTDGNGWWDAGNDSFSINLQGTDPFNGTDIYTPGTVTFK